MSPKSPTSKPFRDSPPQPSIYAMRLGYNTNGFAHHRLDDALTILAELGYESVAITLDHYVLNPFDKECKAECERIAGVMRDLNLGCVIETGSRFILDPRRKHFPTLLARNADSRHRRYQFLFRAIEIARWLNADAVSFWSGASDAQLVESDAWQILINSCRDIVDVAEIMQVRLAFEPEPGMFIDTMERFERLHSAVDHPLFGLTLDVGHLHCQGELPIATHIHRWRDWLWNVHIEDMRKGMHDHLMFGDGEMDFPPILSALRAIDYGGGVHVELSRHSHDAVNTARRAMAFLQQQIQAQG